MMKGEWDMVSFFAKRPSQQAKLKAREAPKTSS